MLRIRLSYLLVVFTICFNSISYSQEKSRIGDQFIGGFFSANPDAYPVFKNEPRKIKYFVNNERELIVSLSNSRYGDVIYLDANGKFDLTGKKSILIPSGVTLLSNRGDNKSSGALVFTNTLDTHPLFLTGGGDITISGIRFKGPDGLVVNTTAIRSRREELKKINPLLDTYTSKFNVYGIGNSNFIQITSENISIENCEIFNWSHAGIFIKAGGQATITFSYIHHNQRTGLGYGIMHDQGSSVIKGNIFDFNRHAIAGTGAPGTSYNAQYNITLKNHSGHVFDMHGGKDRGDGTNIAGDRIIISNNTFHLNDNFAVVVRGVPTKYSLVENNLVIYHGIQKKKVLNPNSFFRQSGSVKRFHVKNNKAVGKKAE